jgi:hypothetical protein
MCHSVAFHNETASRRRLADLFRNSLFYKSLLLSSEFGIDGAKVRVAAGPERRTVLVAGHVLAELTRIDTFYI